MNDNKYNNLTQEEYLAVVKNAPLVAVDLIIRNRKNEILLGLRKEEPAKGFWFVPGGRIHKGETIQKAFGDIARYKLGINVEFSDTALLGVHEHFYDTNPYGLEKCSTHFLSIVYEINVDFLRIDQLPDDQHEGWKWFSFTDLMDSPEVHDNTKQFVSSS